MRKGVNTILPMGNLCENYCSIWEFVNIIVRMSPKIFTKEELQSLTVDYLQNTDVQYMHAVQYNG